MKQYECTELLLSICFIAFQTAGKQFGLAWYVNLFSLYKLLCKPKLWLLLHPSVHVISCFFCQFLTSVQVQLLILILWVWLFFHSYSASFIYVFVLQVFCMTCLIYAALMMWFRLFQELAHKRMGFCPPFSEIWLFGHHL